MIDAGDIIWNLKLDGQAAFDKSLKGITNNAKKVGVGMTAAGAAITGALGLAAKSAADFNTTLSAINTLGVKDLGALESAIKDTSVAFGLDLTAATEATYQAISAGVSELEAPLILEKAAKAAAAGQTDLTTAIELGTSVVNAMGMEMSDINVVFDQAFVAVKSGVTTFEELGSSVGKLTPTMKAAGLQTDEMFASIAALTKGGINTSESVTGLQAVLTGVIKPTSEATKLAESLGLEFNTTALASKGLKGFLDSLKDATGGNVDQMAQLFGSVEALKTVLVLTGAGAEDFGNILQEMKDGTGATQEAFDKMVEADPAFAFRQLKAAMTVLSVEVGTALLPALSRIVEIVRPIVGKITDWLQANPQLVATIVTVVAAIGGLMVVFGPLLIALPLIGAAIGVLGTVFAAIASPIGLVIAAIVGVVAVLVTLLKPVLEAAVGWIKDNWDEISAIFRNALRVITSILQIGWEIIKAIFGTIMAVIQGFVEGWGAAWDDVTGTTDEKTGTFLGTMGDTSATFAEIMEAILVAVKVGGEFIASHFDDIVAAAKFFSENFIKPLMRVMKFMGQFVSVVADALFFVIDLVFDTLAAIARLPGGVAEFLGFADGGVVPGFADGGMVKSYAQGGVTDHRIVRVGERGPELVALPVGSRVMSNEDMRQTQSQGGGTFTITMHNTITQDLDIDRVARELGTKIQREMSLRSAGGWANGG